MMIQRGGGSGGIACFIVLLLLSVLLVKGEWSGEFTDSTFGGSLFVCQSQVTETDGDVITIGQGMFSRLGYMRGSVMGNVWQGEYFMAGIEARHGSFNLTLTNNGLSYDGSFTESVGYSYSMSGNKISNSSPMDTDCFKTDESLLTQESLSTPYSFTSNSVATNIASNSTQNKVTYADSNDHVSVSWTASFGIGFNYGPTFVSGQVVCAQWYEGNAKEGLELLVARDVNSFYSIWLMSSSVAVFNYTKVVVIDNAYGVETNEISDRSVSADEGMAYSYLRLLTSNDETTCSDAMAGSSLNCDDDDNDIIALLVILLSVICCLNIAFLFYYFVYRERLCLSKTPIEEKDSYYGTLDD